MIRKLQSKIFFVKILAVGFQKHLSAPEKTLLSTMSDENLRQVSLNNGVKMPILGLGTYKMQGEVVEKAIDCAFRKGYRAIDSAAGYNNEKEIGSTLKRLLPELLLERKDVFITTKLPPSHHGAQKCESMFLTSLGNLDTSYVDLYLIHWPGVSGHATDDNALPKLRRETWMKMEELYSQGKIRAIGVSNYTIKHLEELFSYCTVKPTVNQVEYHPHLVQKELYEFCKSHDVHLQAYSSLGTSSSTELLNDNVVIGISKKYDKLPAQVLLKWAIQQQIGVIPKASNLEHVKSNFNLWDFSLSAEDMKQLYNLSQRKRYCWDPETVI